MLSQSIPQLVSSAITIVSVFASMCMLSWQLTIVTMLMVALMLFCSKKITQQSGKYFIAQQRDLGKVNGYIEEMMEGQKVVKVFTHEQKALEGFRELNDKLKDSAKQANSFANIMMPVNAQLGNISYAICALVGAAMAVTGMGGVTLGTVMAFLSLNKSFNMPISQVSMQANSIIMALAGAERIFKMMDEPSETDEGYVTLINAKYDKDDNLVEANERTGIWAWKHPHLPQAGRRHHLYGRRFRLCAGQDRPARHQPLWPSRPEDRLRRLHWRRQDHHHQPYQPLLRHPGRQDPVRRHQHP